MGVLPLQLPDGESPASLGLTGHEVIDVVGLAGLGPDDPIPHELTVRAGATELRAQVRIDTPKEADYFRHGGILHYVLRQLA
jgi:aconitate hydratase